MLIVIFFNIYTYSLEPTTGLDSTAAYSIVKYLTKVAKSTNVAIIMTIYQPSALVFEMLDDLLLLETGRTVFAGSIKDASAHFESLGYLNPEKINPADYYLNLVQNKPTQHTEEAPVTWDGLFRKSKFQSQFDELLENTLACDVKKPVSALPSLLTRLSIMIKYFGFYYIRERRYYVFRLCALILIAVFTGTLWLNLQPTTENISDYASAVFQCAMWFITSHLGNCPVC